MVKRSLKEVDEDNVEDNGGEDNNDSSSSSSKTASKPKRVKKETIKSAEGKKTAEAAKKASSAKEGKAKAAPKKVAVKKEAAAPKKAAVPKKQKEYTKMAKLEEARTSFKWWEAAELPEGMNWRQLEQPGILFPDSYEPHGKPLIYDGKALVLPPHIEELASFYAAMPLDGPQLGGPSCAIFQRNFFKDFKEALGEASEIKEFDKCDWSEIRTYLELQKSLKKAATIEEKDRVKSIKDKNSVAKGFCIIDGHLEKMGNFNMEPPSLFRGRGDHPLTGTVKARTYSEQVMLNMSVDAAVPKCDLPGRHWQAVQHDPEVTWLCGWKENVQDANKYVMLSAASSFKGKSDRDKYGKAINLRHCIDKVRKSYKTLLASTDKHDRQLGAAMWVIDVLALRVGGEKNEDEADTVGCCSLRVEHMRFNEDPNSYELELEFLGKDSMQFKQTINFATIEHPSGDVGKDVFRCFKSFCAGKRSSDEILDTLNPTLLNKHLSSLMKDLTAKVFRTFNASITLENELPGDDELRGKTVQEKVTLYNDANRLVAILCNHQKTVSKAQENQLEKLDNNLVNLKNQLEQLKQWLGMVKKGNASKVPIKPDDSKIIEKIAKDVSTATKQKEMATTNEEKVAAVKAVDDAKAAARLDGERKAKVMHMYKTTPTQSSLENRINNWGEKISAAEFKMKAADDNKEVALGTSKINYMDPRISVAWCKRHEIPIDKVFAKALREKFNWAMAVEPDWKFE